MRILHTADWHLNDRLYRVQRQGDIVARLEEIDAYLEAYKVDVMVVAGDLFSTFTAMDEIRDAVSDVNRVFRPFLLGGGTILAISGNHDREPLFGLLRIALDLAYPVDLPSDAPRPPGRLYLAEQPGYLKLEDRSGQCVQFAVFPYPTVARYLRDERTKFTSTNEKNRLLQQALIHRLNTMKQKHIDPRLPAVLVSHIHVRGGKLHNLYHITEREDVVFEPGDIPTHWSYMAYGHIHRPQKIAGTEHAQYAGSIERLDFAEAGDKKSVVLVEIADGQRQSEPEILPLHSTPLYKFTVRDPEKDIPALIDQYPDADQAIVDYQLVYKPGEHNPDTIMEELEGIFPRWCRRTITPLGSDVQIDDSAWESKTADVAGTVMDYLKETLSNHDDRDDLLTLADELLASLEDEK